MTTTITEPNGVSPTDLPRFTIGTYHTTRPLGTLVASARRITGKEARKVKRHNPDWQDEAWDMYDLVGEQHFLSTTLAGRMSQARLYVGEIGDNLTDAPEPTDDRKVSALLESIGDTAAGRSQLMERLEVNMFVAGEGWMVGLPPQTVPGSDDPPSDDVLDLVWRALSVTEVSSSNDEGKVKIQWDENETIEVSPDDIYLIRVWRPHPRKWWEADSSTRASLPVLRELVGLTMHISAQVDSRLAGAGVFFIPQSARDAMLARLGHPEDAEEDPFTDALIEAMVTPIEDRAAASALVPLTVTVPDESIEKFRHLSFANDLDSEARELREESIRRLALGQDAPPEVLLGTAGMNHWGAWLVREDVVTTHLEPPLALICDALTVQFLWPVLESWGWDKERRERFVIWYDVSDLVTRPNRSQDALVLHERGVISDAALRRELGFDDNDAPSETEEIDLAVSTALKLVQGAPSLMSDPGLEHMVEAIRRVLEGSPAPEEPVAAPTGDGDSEDAAPANVPQTDGAPAEVPAP